MNTDAKNSTTIAKKAQLSTSWNTDIHNEPGFSWIKAKIEAYDHARLEALHIDVLTPEGNGPASVAEYRTATQSFGKVPVAGILHKIKDGKYRIEVVLRPWDLPSSTAVHYPPLYRRPGGVWEPERGADCARRFDNEVLDAYSALCEAPGHWDKAEAWALEHQLEDGTQFGTLVKLERDGFWTEYVQVRGPFLLNDLNEAIVFGVAKHCYHWLRHTNQIADRKSHYFRDKFAMDHVREFVTRG